MSAPTAARPQQQHKPHYYTQPSSPPQTQSPVALAHRASVRSSQHTRQTSGSRNPNPRDPPPTSTSRRDQEYTTRTSTSTSTRSEHSRHPSNMSERATNGASAVGDDSRQTHNSSGQKPRKTTINGVTGTWVLGKTIGAGSMGKVKIARKLDGTEQGAQVAVKIVPRSTDREHSGGRAPRDESKEIRTAREAAIVTLLDHPYICGMRDVVRTNHHWYMLFEYVNGGQMLDYIISHGRLKEKQARKFGRQIASALDYCHRNSIVHRDLKIENILISKTGDIKIIDFGLSNLFSPRSLLSTFCGSLYFAAPELLQAKPYIGPEVDIWSFGIVLYVLVCGKVPFDDQSMPALHAKIKRGLVDYPAWITADCKNLLSRMLVTDPRSRITLAEIMNHPWMLKGADGPPRNYLPPREPISLPLDPNVVLAMTGFEFGTPETITALLTRVVESDEYQQAARVSQRESVTLSPSMEKKKPFQFDFYKRRSSTSSKDTLTNASSELLSHSSTDPLNAFHPLLSIYYLVKEKQDRDKRLELTTAEASTAQAISKSSSGHKSEGAEKSLQVPIIPVPEIAHTSDKNYEGKGDSSATDRNRTKTRTHEDEDVADSVKKLNVKDTPKITGPAYGAPLDKDGKKRESTAAGILRRLSTRRHSSRHESKTVPSSPGQSGALSPTGDVAAPRKSLSVRQSRESGRDAASYREGGGSSNQQYLTPPGTADDQRNSSSSKRSSKLGRSTSVSEVDWRKRRNKQESPPRQEDEKQTNKQKFLSTASAADRFANRPGSSGAATSSSVAKRATSVGHARRESYSHRRKKDEAEQNVPGEVPEEEDQTEIATSIGSGEGVAGTPSIDHIKPVFLKGLLSVSTTTTKPPIAIRADIMRVLDQLGVTYKEIRSGFSCTHKPSIDLKSVADNVPQSPEMSTSSHRRKISFGGRDSSSITSPLKSPIRRARGEGSSVNNDMSNDSVHGEGSSQIQSELGGSMILQFEIYIVKVPLMNMYGIQQKKIGGNTWSYKNMITKIISELRL